MVHPLFKYLIGSYNNNETLAKINTEFFKISIDNYNDYTGNKIEIDKPQDAIMWTGFCCKAT